MTASRATADAMFPLVETYVNGQFTQKAFCAEHGISQGKLNYWLAKYRRQTREQAGDFIEITPGGAPDERALLEVVFPHGVRLRFFTPVEPAYLERLLTFERLVA
jgi:hypothetical protein